MVVPSVAERLADARRHGAVDLACCNLARCPPALAHGDLAPTLWRVDLSANRLVGPLPAGLGVLTGLRVLWVNDNPELTALPASLASACPRLEVIDASATALTTLPCELGRLGRLKVLDITATPLETRWLGKGHLTSAGDPGRRCQEILRKLRRKDERTQLKRELYDRLHDDVYRIERQDHDGARALDVALRRLLKVLPLADEVRSVIRNAERFFPAAFSPAAMAAMDAGTFRRSFDALRTENEMKKKAADLEIKIRNLYFDRIDPTTVEGIVRAIYAEIRELRDIKFLLRHATVLFPKEAKDIDGRRLRAALVALQDELARERAAAIDKLFAAAKGIYCDTEPEQVRALVTRVAGLFKSTKDLRSLAADAAMLFPPEFLNAQPQEIRAAFLQAKAETLGKPASGGAGGGSAAASTSSLASSLPGQK